MKKLFIVLSVCTLLSMPAFAVDCNKEQAKASVTKICDLISSKGKGALKDIGKYRYCGSNYVWIQNKTTSNDIQMVLHPIKRRLNGKSIKSNQDENGVLLFQEFEKIARGNPDGGWVSYVWAKPGAEKATDKVSFVKVCGGGLGWIAGSGIWK